MPAPVVLAFYKGRQAGPFTSWLVAWWCRTDYSHCELLLDRWAWYRYECGSSVLTDGGVRVKVRDLDPLQWDCYLIDDIGVDYARAWFGAHKSERYDLLGWLGFIFRRIKGLGNGWWCSEACAAALGIPDPWRWDVALLAALARRIGRPVALQDTFVERLTRG